MHSGWIHKIRNTKRGLTKLEALLYRVVQNVFRYRYLRRGSRVWHTDGRTVGQTEPLLAIVRSYDPRQKRTSWKVVQAIGLIRTISFKLGLQCTECSTFSFWNLREVVLVYRTMENPIVVDMFGTRCRKKSDDTFSRFEFWHRSWLWDCQRMG